VLLDGGGYGGARVVVEERAFVVFKASFSWLVATIRQEEENQFK
jgi:hypothetical protein